MVTDIGDWRGLRPHVLYLGICSLLGFVVLVPHRYLFSYDDSIAGLAINSLEFLPFVLSLLLLLAMGLRGRVVQSVPREVLLPIALWLGLSVLSGVGSELPHQALLRDLYYAITGVLLSLVAALAFRDRWASGARLLVLLSALVGLGCVYEFATGRHLWASVFTPANAKYLLFAPEGVFGRRVIGTVGHPVFLGSFLVLVLPMGLWMIFQSAGSRIVLSIAATVLVLSGLILTFSRGAWLGGVVGCLVYLRYRSSKQIWGVAVAVCVLLSVGFSVDRVWHTLKSRDTIEQLGRFKTDQRGVAYAQSARVLSGQPLLGVGTGLYQFTGRHADDHDRTMDNMYLRLLSEHGVAGFAAITILLGSICRVLSVASVRGNEALADCRVDFCRAVLASITGFLVDLATCDALYFDVTRICFWIVVGLGLAAAAGPTQKEAHP